MLCVWLAAPYNWGYSPVQTHTVPATGTGYVSVNWEFTQEIEVRGISLQPMTVRSLVRPGSIFVVTIDIFTEFDSGENGEGQSRRTKGQEVVIH